MTELVNIGVARQKVKVSGSDIVLFLAFAYSSIDIWQDWAAFSGCSRPIQQWLLVSYSSMVAFRLSHYAGQYSSSDGEDFLLYFRQRSLPPKFLLYFTWILLLPFFVVWTTLGTYWFVDIWKKTPDCLPDDTHRWFIIFWQLLCYVWMMIYFVFIAMAFAFERRVSRAEENLRSIETPDILRRWGRISFLGEGMAAALSTTGESGLTPEEIHSLPAVQVDDEVQILACGDQCSICLEDFKVGDKNRRLPSCRHVFHQSCIDLWLLRRADCPLCKGMVLKQRGGAGTPGYNSMDTAPSIRVP